MTLAKLLKFAKQDAEQKYVQAVQEYQREREKEAKRDEISQKNLVL